MQDLPFVFRFRFQSLLEKRSPPMDCHTDTRVLCAKEGGGTVFFYFWVFFFFPNMYLPHTSFFYMCIYNKEYISHVSAPDNTPWVTGTSSAHRPRLPVTVTVAGAGPGCIPGAAASLSRLLSAPLPRLSPLGLAFFFF